MHNPDTNGHTSYRLTQVHAYADDHHFVWQEDDDPFGNISKPIEGRMSNGPKINEQKTKFIRMSASEEL